MPKHAEPGFMDFGWGTWGVIVGGVVVVALFMGPGMWSSSTEFLGVTLWRWLRGRSKRRSLERERSEQK